MRSSPKWIIRLILATSALILFVGVSIADHLPPPGPLSFESALFSQNRVRQCSSDTACIGGDPTIEVQSDFDLATTGLVTTNVSIENLGAQGATIAGFHGDALMPALSAYAYTAGPQRYTLGSFGFQKYEFLFDAELTITGTMVYSQTGQIFPSSENPRGRVFGSLTAFQTHDDVFDPERCNLFFSLSASNISGTLASCVQRNGQFGTEFVGLENVQVADFDTSSDPVTNGSSSAQLTVIGEAGDVFFLGADLTILAHLGGFGDIRNALLVDIDQPDAVRPAFSNETYTPDVFSIVIVPDTQMYVEQHPEVFEAQVDWIVANEAAENIIYVAHLGDLKDDLSCDTKTVNVGTGEGRSEWEIVDDTLGDLDVAGIAYGVVPGNHDFDQVSNTCPNFSTQRPLGTYNSLLGPLRFAGSPHYGDPGVPTPGNRVVNSNEDNFTLFESSGVKLIAINLAYKQGANAVNNDPEVVWADALLKAYPDRLGIITSHYLMDGNPGNSLGPYGQEIYDGLSNNPNLFMMLSAHEFGEAWLVETTGRGGMEPVQILLSDYQRDVFPAVDGDINTPPNDPNAAGIDFTDIDQTIFGDSGFMRIMRFDTVTGMVNIETFIPPVNPIKERPGTLVSTYFPASGAGMGESTASNLSFSYLGYVP